VPRFTTARVQPRGSSARRRLRALTVPGLLAVAAVAYGPAAAPTLESAPASSSQPQDPFVVSPGQGPPFTVVNVSGANCLGPAPSVVGELESAAGAIPGANAVFFVTPNAGGEWSDAFTVPPVVAPGTHRVVARCLPDQFNPQPVEYAPQPFEVLADGRAAMSVSPQQAAVGRDVELSVSGTLCRGTAPQVDVRVELAESQEADEFIARGFFTPDANGDWSGQVVVPAATDPVTFIVTAVCNLADRQFFIYLPPVEVHVVRPAVPVTGSPTFTG
jgi:hypothetical protein